MKKLRIIVGGYIGLMPVGGLTWHYVQYPVGFAELGHDVFYIENTRCYPIYQKEVSKWDDCSLSVEYLSKVMDFFGMSERWAYRDVASGKCFGLPLEKVQEIINTADILVNVSCSTSMSDELQRIPVRILLDTDPMFVQIQLVKPQKIGTGNPGMREMVKASNYYFTFGENIAAQDCHIPTGGLKWHPTRQPICLKYWNADSLKATSSGALTTVMNWAAAKRLRYEGEFWGQKNVEFKKYLSLPKLVPEVQMTVAVTQAAKTGTSAFPIEKAEAKGWQVLDPEVCAGNWISYQNFIENSLGEFSVAKEIYVKARTGWFSDRSACYLASGRPVIAQETGWSKFIPTGKGVFAFDNQQSAVEAIREVTNEPEKHSLAVREIAKEFFDSKKVLKALLEKVT
ncbi:MAG: hypothetical protein M3Q33_02410 [Acidobacteriota bacterium]|nr:hypothetical protein [Acidobacteriota bacterium]